MKNQLIQFWQKIKISFQKANKKQETLKILVVYWLLLSLPFFYLIISILAKSNIKLISLTLGILIMIYYLWHIIAIFRCTPKKTNKGKFRFSNIPKSLGQKLLLKRPWIDTRFSTVIILIDLFLILTILEKI